MDVFSGDFLFFEVPSPHEKKTPQIHKSKDSQGVLADLNVYKHPVVYNL